MLDLQRAGMWKRLSAALFDAIILFTVIVGMALLLSTVLNYDGYVTRLDGLEQKYGEKFGVDLNITAEEMEKLTKEELAVYEAADKAFGADPDVVYTYNMMLSMAVVIVTFSILLGYLLLEFLVPLLWKNGQTFGKKLFGIAVMRVDGVRLPAILLFARTVLGKFTIGTMIPVYVIIMIIFGRLGMFGTVIIGALLLVQAILFFGTRDHTPIHDKLAGTVTVDLASQMIFESPEALLEYKKRIHAESTERRER
ncbi:MAG: RDD family protein [Clostridia bacterium]|nr:RDD family protein [Clostridia bacterium]